MVGLLEVLVVCTEFEMSNNNTDTRTHRNTGTIIGHLVADHIWHFSRTRLGVVENE